ncbi:serine/threonine-protein kinase [Actinoplanes regularis]|uniref:serine/threonine-protein kinase n=1 Tax=Actinoplanes regularis TaxID=52697 RepID=UPI0024A15B8D|nr:serine/threonine-protein kinase [Actinoplanes regularis]GLW28141.1 putative serine/threonine-protein kinase PknA [Actinoplanes regularis]
MRTLGGRYRLERRIGVGGMSEVWRGHDRVLDRPVAVKIMAPAVTGTLGEAYGVDLIRAEARSAARLAHPNVASVHDFGTSPASDREVPYIVMELVEGRTLSEHLGGGLFDWHIAVRVCAEVAAALAAAHAKHVVHRDIKPANIMLTPAGAKVLDFGIAATVGSYDSDPDGPVMGTPAYVAPERFSGLPATPASDMYSLGVLLYHCLSGRLPWSASSHTELVDAQHQRDPEPLPHIEGLAPEVLDLCSRCLHRDPAERPTALLAALLLAEAVDARVHIPMMDPAAAMPRPSAPPPWDTNAAEAPTDVALPANAGATPPASRYPDERQGRHRAA